MLTNGRNIQREIKAAMRRALISIALNLFLCIGKAIAGIASNSNALIGDAIHSATDVLGSGAVFVGLLAAGRKHPSFPYGLYKAETVASLVTSIFILVAGYEIARRAILGPETTVDVWLAIPVAATCFVITIGFGLYQISMGKKLNSPALISDGKDYLADAMSTGVVLGGFLGTLFGLKLDRWAAAIVSLFVFRSGGQVLLSALKDLLDTSIDRETERAIIKFVESHPKVVRVERCLSRITGGRFIIDLDVVMNTPHHRVADQVCDHLEEEIIKSFPKVIMARIRPHYGRSHSFRSVTPVMSTDGEVADHVSKAPFFMVEVKDGENGRVISREFVENPHLDCDRRRGLLVGQFLLSLKPDRLNVKKDKDSTVFALLKEVGVEIREIDQGDHGERSVTRKAQLRE